MFSLGIEGGTLVTPSGRRRSNVYIADGRIAAISPESFPAEQKVDADGLLVLPGMVDAHVHFMDPGALEREDFPTGSAAAAIAGVTTVIEHTHARPVRTGREVQEKAAYLATRSHIDYGLAAHVWPDKLADICSAWATGAAYLKIFTCTTHGIPATDAGRLRNIFRIAAEISATCLVHCEDEALTEGAERVLRDAGRTDNGVIPEWRNRDAELASLAVTMLLAARTGAHVIAAHVSNPEALEIVDRYRTAGAFVRAESCPQYLTLREDEILDHGAFRKFTPPARARSQAELDAMWALLNARRIDYLSTDHAPATAAQKQEATIWDVHFGLPGIDTTLPLLLDAAARGVTSYERVVEVYSEMPARLYGFYPRKGGITVGADADLVLVDPTGTWEVSDDDIVSKAGWSPFAGRTLLGRVRQTYLRGQLIASDRTVLGACGVGKFIAGRGAARSAPIEWT